MSDVRKRPTRKTGGKVQKRLAYDILGEPVDDGTMVTNQL